MGANLPDVDLGGLLALQLSAGYDHNCALLQGGFVKCWGDNGNGRLGYGDSTRRGDGGDEMGENLPSLDLDGLAVAIYTGDLFNCAIMVGGFVKCWGYNGYGNLGYGDTTQRGDGSDEM